MLLCKRYAKEVCDQLSPILHGYIKNHTCTLGELVYTWWEDWEWCETLANYPHYEVISEMWYNA